MKNLTIKNHKGINVIDSREVAEMIGKKHDNLLRDIRGYIKVIEESSKLRSQDFFIESTYKNSQNKSQPCYLLTKQGCEMVVVPHGTYEVEVNKMELKKSKKGDPMLSIWFKIINGQHKGSLIFYNQVLTSGFGLHNANEMLRSLDSGVEVEFVNFKQYYEMLLDIYESVNSRPYIFMKN